MLLDFITLAFWHFDKRKYYYYNCINKVSPNEFIISNRALITLFHLRNAIY